MPVRNPARENALYQILTEFGAVTGVLKWKYLRSRGKRQTEGRELYRLLCRDTITAIYAATRPTRKEKSQ